MVKIKFRVEAGFFRTTDHVIIELRAVNLANAVDDGGSGNHEKACATISLAHGVKATAGNRRELMYDWLHSANHERLPVAVHVDSGPAQLASVIEKAIQRALL